MPCAKYYWYVCILGIPNGIHLQEMDAYFLIIHCKVYTATYFSTWLTICSTYLKRYLRIADICHQGRRNWEGQGGDSPPPPYFGRSVNPIPTRGADYSHNLATRSTGFSERPTALLLAVKIHCCCHRTASKWLTGLLMIFRACLYSCSNKVLHANVSPVAWYGLPTSN